VIRQVTLGLSHYYCIIRSFNYFARNYTVLDSSISAHSTTAQGGRIRVEVNIEVALAGTQKVTSNLKLNSWRKPYQLRLPK
jgi:hypothetical protein